RRRIGSGKCRTGGSHTPSVWSGCGQRRGVQARQKRLRKDATVYRGGLSRRRRSNGGTMNGHFGKYGGQFFPETLMHPLEELEAAYMEAQRDAAFQAELDDLFHNYSGRPTPLYFAERLTQAWQGGKIYLKREDLNHTGAHKINNCLGQGLLARRMGKK